jgi:hypothetical protein
VITKRIQARHLGPGMEIVEGGDGVRRTAYKITEIHVDREKVEVVVRLPDRFDRRTFAPRDPVRIRLKETP